MLTLKIEDLYELSKYTNILNSDIKVETSNNLKKIYDVDITAKNSKIIKIFTHKHELLGSPDHLVKCDNIWKKIKNIKIGDKIETKHGLCEIVGIKKINYTDDLYDLHVKDNEYYTNDITSHNSSLISSLDLALYGEEHNKKGKRLNKSNFPNRTNDNMTVGVEFETDETLVIERKMQNKQSPIKTKLYIDKIPYTQATKIQEKIEEKIGFDFKTYKSFISMDVNNFKNFISLTPEDKRILLDKIFNLSKINDLNKIFKELKKSNELDYNSIKNEIHIYENNILDLKESIKELQEKKKEKVEKNNEDFTNQINEIKKIIKENKSKIEKIDIQKNELKEAINTFKNGIEKLKTKRNKIINDISNLKEKIALYDSGKCPTCHTDLSNKLDLKEGFKEELEKTNLLNDKINDKIKNANKELIVLEQDLNNLNNNYQDILIETKSKKNKLTLIEEKINENKEDDNIDGEEILKKNIQKLETKHKEKGKEYFEVQKLKFVYDLLTPMWSDKGIKQDIINSIIDPINAYIQEDLESINTRFRIELDANFNAIITEFGQEIDPDTLSTGEEKKVNLIIMLAYIKMLRNKQNINVLFLDEVFASIDIQGIDDILFLFKKFANERKINIFLVHHSELKEHLFDKIIEIEKNNFSYINIK